MFKKVRDFMSEESPAGKPDGWDILFIVFVIILFAVLIPWLAS